MCWKVNFTCPVAESCVTGSAREAGAAAELAASRKDEMQALVVTSQYFFAPIAVETLGPMNTSARQLCQSAKKDLLGVRR